MTHIIFCRRCHGNHHMTLSDALPGRRLFGHRDRHGQVSGPGPQHGRIGDGHVDVVTVLREVGLPDGLRRTVRSKGHSPSHDLSRTHGSREPRTFHICSHLVHDPACDAHAVKDGHINNSGHSSVVYGLGTVGPHVRTLCQVDVAGRQTVGHKDSQDWDLNIVVFLSERPIFVGFPFVNVICK